MVFNMKFITLLLILTIGLEAMAQSSLLESFAQADTFKIAERFSYLKKVRPTDTLCLRDIEKATRQMAGDTLTFVVAIGFGSNLRYESELVKICEENNLKYELELGGCVIWEGQTQGCYKDYLDYKLFEKYGKNFKVDLHKKANDLYLANHLNDTISEWDCDQEPTFIGKKISSSGVDMMVNLPVKEKRREWISKGEPMFAVYQPFMDLRFVIDKNGDISNFALIRFIPQQEENEKYKDELFELAIKEIKDKYSKWKPGEINGVPLNTTYVLRVAFKNAT
jgi:hypothetical protein